MATRSFLLENEEREGLARLLPAEPLFPEKVHDTRADFSAWLEARLLGRLQALGDFARLKPVLLGSWARHELCPKSDIDLLLAGDESEVKEFVGRAFASGLKLRSRTPENPADWSVGVEPFDVLALGFAIGFNHEAQELLDAQKGLAKKWRTKILRAVRTEREERRKRQDSISNYLEPNLKFGAGGLRDIEQALAMRELFAEKFADADPYPFKVLGQIKDELLYLRSIQHLSGSSDILSANDQLDLAVKLKMESAGALTKFLQSELERASFYADWCVTVAASGPKALRLAPLKSLEDAVKRLIDHPGQLLQFQIRLQVDRLAKPLSTKAKGKILHQALHKDARDSALVGLHRARVLEVLVPDLKKLRGLVQHDHYHRFTADAHLVQTLREVQRAKSEKRRLGVLSKLSRDLSPADWWTLKLTALFHDLAKGREKDHSTEGAKLVRKYFDEWEYPEALREDAAWLVENHLLLSTAAFRQNPQSQSTWKRLFERGVHGRRLILLALFTAIDIRATNPEALTPWKSQLLYDLVGQLSSKPALGLQRHLNYASDEPAMKELLAQLDPALLQSLSPRIVVEDLREALRAREDLPPKVLRSGGRLWVRFHRREDQPGTFLSYVRRLYGLGLNIQMSAVHTLRDIGVYDWFCLRTEKHPRQVGQWLTLPPRQTATPKVEFQSIELMSQDQDEWIFSFRGRDQRGLLLAAAQALVEEKLSLRWARAHTWGQQIDDIFSVQPLGEVETTLDRLRRRFVT
jgi:[protein-PII] uridylyltransferase